MLAHAKEKNVYHTLIRAELTEYLRNQREAFDLIVSADTLVYFGNLKDVIAAVSGALRPNGLFIFTLERAVGCGAGVDYRLEPHGRYSHTQTYVEHLFNRFGLEFENCTSRITHGSRSAGARTSDSCDQV